MYYLYLDQVLVSECETFSEVCDIIFHEIVTWKVKDLEDRIIRIADDIIVYNYARTAFCFTYLDSNHENQVHDSITIEVYHG